MESGFDSILPSFQALLLLTIVGYVYLGAVLSVLARKTVTESPWMAWVPVLNLILMCRIGQQPAWLVFLFFVPLVNIVMFVVVWMAIARVRGKSPALGFLMVVPLVNFFVPLILASGASSNVAAPAARISVPPAATGSVCPACGRTECVGEDFCGYTGQRILPATGTELVTTASPQSQTPGARVSSVPGALYWLGGIVVLGILWGLGSTLYQYLLWNYGLYLASLGVVAAATGAGIAFVAYGHSRHPARPSPSSPIHTPGSTTDSVQGFRLMYALACALMIVIGALWRVGDDWYYLVSLGEVSLAVAAIAFAIAVALPLAVVLLAHWQFRRRAAG
jgi:hypothetical protein